MNLTALVSYDDTLNDQDALALARLLAAAGARLVLAYVQHPAAAGSRGGAVVPDPASAALLERGARWLGDLEVERRTVVHASTSEGLQRLASELGADVIVFGSDYRTAAGLVAPQHSTRALLEGGPAAVAIAPAAFRARRDHELRRIGLLAEPGDAAATETAGSLAARFGAEVVERSHGVDLLLVGSRAEAPEGRVMVSAQARNAIEESDAPVLVLARGAALTFASPLYVA